MKLLFPKLLMITTGLVLFQCFGATNVTAQQNDTSFIVGDALPDAPELSARGNYKVGVRTIELINKNQIDILHSKGGIDPLYDRTLTIEIWYPAVIPACSK